MSSYHDNWLEEKRSAYLYQIMAQHENNPLHKKLFRELSLAAETQATMWEKKIKITDHHFAGKFTPDFRTRFIIVLIKTLGTDRIHNILCAMKIRGMSIFRNYHSEHLHTNLNSTSNLRAAVFGINDGLISNMSLILGIAGANANHQTILLAGVAGLLAGACSMGAGEYISVRSQREVFEYQIAIEKEELQEYPEEEMEELSLIYQARGVPKEDAVKLAKIMIENPETGLNTLAREELGLNPEDLVSPVGAMVSSFVSFTIGAALPLFPFVFLNKANALPLSMLMTAISLMLIGMTLSLFTNKSALLSGLRMLFIGAFAGCVTYGIGHLLGVGSVG